MTMLPYTTSLELLCASTPIMWGHVWSLIRQKLSPLFHLHTILEVATFRNTESALHPVRSLAVCEKGQTAWCHHPGHLFQETNKQQGRQSQPSQAAATTQFRSKKADGLGFKGVHEEGLRFRAFAARQVYKRCAVGSNFGR